MAKHTNAIKGLSPQAEQVLQKLGKNIEIARKRRRESRKAFSERLYVSVPTVKRLESGDPGVGLGVLVAALWALGLYRDLEKVAAPENDEVGKTLEYRNMPKSFRTKQSQGKIDNDF